MHKTFGSESDQLFKSVVIRTFRACAERGWPVVRWFIDELSAYEREASYSDAEEPAASAAKSGALCNSQCRIRLWDGCAFDCILSDRTHRSARLLLSHPSRIPSVFTLE